MKFTFAGFRDEGLGFRICIESRPGAKACQEVMELASKLEMAGKGPQQQRDIGNAPDILGLP